MLFEPELENVMQFQCTAFDRTVKLILLQPELSINLNFSKALSKRFIWIQNIILLVIIYMYNHISCIPYPKKLAKMNNSYVLKYLANVTIEMIYVQQYFDFNISVIIAWISR